MMIMVWNVYKLGINSGEKQQVTYSNFMLLFNILLTLSTYKCM